MKRDKLDDVLWYAMAVCWVLLIGELVNLAYLAWQLNALMR